MEHTEDFGVLIEIDGDGEWDYAEIMHHSDREGKFITIMDGEESIVEMSKSTAIAAARAILKHYGEGLE